MRKLTRNTFLLFLAATAVWAALVTAQDLPQGLPEMSQDLRYQFMSHNFKTNGLDQEIYLKLDSYTGKTWRFHASTAKWSPIIEPTQPPANDSRPVVRYELFGHNYYDTNGQEQELILRTDRVTGKAWTYRGANGNWKDIIQEEHPEGVVKGGN